MFCLLIKIYTYKQSPDAARRNSSNIRLSFESGKSVVKMYLYSLLFVVFFIVHSDAIPLLEEGIEKTIG